MIRGGNKKKEEQNIITDNQRNCKQVIISISLHYLLIVLCSDHHYHYHCFPSCQRAYPAYLPACLHLMLWTSSPLGLHFGIPTTCNMQQREREKRKRYQHILYKYKKASNCKYDCELIDNRCQEQPSYLWLTFTIFVPSAAETKKKGRLCFAANLNSFRVTYIAKRVR